MTKQEVKAAVMETLYKVEPVEELPVFIQALKAGTLFKLLLGEITKETADTILQTIKEFWGA